MINVNGTGSSSETWHLELATDAPGFTYEPGDAIGVLPENDPQLAAQLLDTTGLGGDAALAARLKDELDITTLTRPIVTAYAKLTGREDVADLAAADRFAAFAKDRQLIDLFSAFPEKLTPEQLTGLLRPLPARLYSVASSLKAHPGETHLLCPQYAGHRTGARARASPRPGSPTGASAAIRSRCTSSRTGTSACPRTATRRSS